jgi:hypothetical protein
VLPTYHYYLSFFAHDQTAKRVLGTLATIALATSSVPGGASAAAAVKKAAPKAKQLKDIVDFQQAFKDVLDNGPLIKTVGTFVGGGVTALVLSNLLSPADESICETKIGAVFPGALKNKDLVDKVSRNLEKYGFGRSTLLVTSLCADEVNRFLEEDFSSVYGDNFAMGGLAGFPFAGATGFNAMASHIPDGGSCLLVFGPHVGVDSTGAVGTVERRGRAKGGSCCGSAVAAASYATAVSAGKMEKAGPPDSPTDAQQNYVGNMLVPYAPRLEKATDRMVELPYAMYDAQKKMMGDIIKAGAANVAGKIAVLGGIQINTPEGESDFFKPMSFEVYDNTGKLLEDLSPKL